MNLMDDNVIMTGPALPSTGDADCATDNILNSSQLNVLMTNSLSLSCRALSLLVCCLQANEIGTKSQQQHSSVKCTKEYSLYKFLLIYESFTNRNLLTIGFVQFKSRAV